MLLMLVKEPRQLIIVVVDWLVLSIELIISVEILINIDMKQRMFTETDKDSRS